MAHDSLSARTVVRRAGVPFTDLDEELLAIDSQQGLLFSLNQTGGRVWAALVEPVEIGAVCRQLALVYAVDEGTCERDIIAFVEQLREARLVEIVGEAV